ncbi:TPA: helix-turn-helix transcriptional regulator [Legionella pneumophila]|nr:helix-turn-helix transcriptional regulator [Legionella pneumophila]HAU9905843.1 helix-turn-helix transcriptional regulator [Legionella pneumophila]HAU9927289.1 helix-turn-helix transcriptional regulator [Legionella pneumophila]HAU9930222.1 helix-turn-helix transcriptional regulator [Legionella pneumophila]HAU9933892.1 helix-turn-helix transcriptional regulator [Legionella pneumophila]
MSIISEEQLKHRFSSNMRRLMAGKAISENELSKITEISQSAINRIKNGQVCPSLYQATIIANALENKIEDFVVDILDENLEVDSNYIPVISTNNLLGNEQTKILGFVENNMNWRTNTLGFKVDKTFDCKILNNDSIVVSSIDDKLSYIDGDTILFLFNKKYMIGTIHQGSIKPIDNLVMKIDLKNSSIVGRVISIETKYIKDKHTVLSILEKFNVNSLSNIVSSITKSFNLHPA